MDILQNTLIGCLLSTLCQKFSRPEMFANFAKGPPIREIKYPIFQKADKDINYLKEKAYFICKGERFWDGES